LVLRQFGEKLGRHDGHILSLDRSRLPRIHFNLCKGGFTGKAIHVCEDRYETK